MTSLAFYIIYIIII